MVQKHPEFNLDHSHQARRLRGRTWSLILRSAALLVLILAASMPSMGASAQTRVGPKAYYLALGDSLAFGTQPNVDWDHGYTDQLFADLQQFGTQTVVDYGCMGENTSTFIDGKCPWRLYKRTPYMGAQLAAAVKFLRAHPGQVSPVTIDIGANDILWYVGKNTCYSYPNIIASHIAQVDANLTQRILPALVDALTDKSGHRTGDLVLVNMYDPYQNNCPGNDVYFQELNQHLAMDAAKFDIPVADIYSPFNPGPVPTETLCEYTWMCQENDVHPSGGQPDEPGNGYGVIAHVIELTLGY